MKGKSLLPLILLIAALLWAWDGGVPVPFVPDPPVPSDGYRVLILEETADRGKLPPAQLSALLSAKARDYLNQKCVKAGSTPEWRLWDDDPTDLQFASETMRAMHAKAKADSQGKLPWLLVTTSKSGVSQPFPANEEELLSILRRYGE